MFYVWVILSFVLQRPLIAGLVVLGIWVLADRTWFRRSSPWQWFKRRQGIANLRNRLNINPHDRDARFKLAELLVGTGSCDEAYGLLEQNLEAGDHDDETLWLAGKAAFASTRSDGSDLGEKHLAAAKGKSASFRRGAIDLELGRGRLRHGRYAEAKAALQHAIEARPGSMEAHVLLARAQAKLGAEDEAKATKQNAWVLYKEAPLFRRRLERFWAWKANPIAAVRHYGLIVVVVIGVAFALPHIAPSSDYDDDIGVEENWNVDVSSPPGADRFALESNNAPVPSTARSMIARWDLNENGTVDLNRKLFAGDFWCRIAAHYPELAEHPAVALTVKDSQGDGVFNIGILELSYYSTDMSPARLREAAISFEKLLESQPPADCKASVDLGETTQVFGMRGGNPFGKMSPYSRLRTE